jgi:hypothetical protein
VESCLESLRSGYSLSFFNSSIVVVLPESAIACSSRHTLWNKAQQDILDGDLARAWKK